MIKKMPFGNTGHDSSRIIFGAAAFMSMRQDRVDPYLDMLLDFGDVTLSAAQEQALLRLIEEKPLLRGRAAKFMEKGATLTLE